VNHEDHAVDERALIEAEERQRRREQDDAAKHAEQRSVEAEEGRPTVAEVLVDLELTEEFEGLDGINAILSRLGVDHNEVVDALIDHRLAVWSGGIHRSHPSISKPVMAVALEAFVIGVAWEQRRGE
jgi:hypothetical protein